MTHRRCLYAPNHTQLLIVHVYVCIYFCAELYIHMHRILSNLNWTGHQRTYLRYTQIESCMSSLDSSYSEKMREGGREHGFEKAPTCSPPLGKLCSPIIIVISLLKKELCRKSPQAYNQSIGIWAVSLHLQHVHVCMVLVMMSCAGVQICRDEGRYCSVVGTHCMNRWELHSLNLSHHTCEEVQWTVLSGVWVRIGNLEKCAYAFCHQGVRLPKYWVPSFTCRCAQHAG